MLAEQALAAKRMADGSDAAARIALARFFAENIAVCSADSNASCSKAPTA